MSEYTFENLLYPSLIRSLEIRSPSGTLLTLFKRRSYSTVSVFVDGFVVLLKNILQRSIPRNEYFTTMHLRILAFHRKLDRRPIALSFAYLFSATVGRPLALSISPRDTHFLKILSLFLHCYVNKLALALQMHYYSDQFRLVREKT